MLYIIYYMYLLLCVKPLGEIVETGLVFRIVY